MQEDARGLSRSFTEVYNACSAGVVEGVEYPTCMGVGCGFLCQCLMTLFMRKSNEERMSDVRIGIYNYCFRVRMERNEGSQLLNALMVEMNISGGLGFTN